MNPEDEVDISALEGWLFKEKSKTTVFSGVTGEANMRWFRIEEVKGSEGKELALCYFKKPTDNTCRGWIFLKDISEITEQKDVMIIKSNARTMRLSAQTRAEHRLWLTGIVKLSSPSFVKLQSCKHLDSIDLSSKPHAIGSKSEHKLPMARSYEESKELAPVADMISSSPKPGMHDREKAPSRSKLRERERRKRERREGSEKPNEREHESDKQCTRDKRRDRERDRGRDRDRDRDRNTGGYSERNMDRDGDWESATAPSSTRSRGSQGSSFGKGLDESGSGIPQCNRSNSWASENSHQSGRHTEDTEYAQSTDTTPGGKQRRRREVDKGEKDRNKTKTKDSKQRKRRSSTGLRVKGSTHHNRSSEASPSSSPRHYPAAQCRGVRGHRSRNWDDISVGSGGEQQEKGQDGQDQDRDQDQDGRLLQQGEEQPQEDMVHCESHEEETARQPDYEEGKADESGEHELDACQVPTMGVGRCLALSTTKELLDDFQPSPRPFLVPEEAPEDQELPSSAAKSKQRAGGAPSTAEAKESFDEERQSGEIIKGKRRTAADLGCGDARGKEMKRGLSIGDKIAAEPIEHPVPLHLDEGGEGDVELDLEMEKHRRRTSRALLALEAAAKDATEQGEEDSLRSKGCPSGPPPQSVRKTKKHKHFRRSSSKHAVMAPPSAPPPISPTSPAYDYDHDKDWDAEESHETVPRALAAHEAADEGWLEADFDR